MAKYTVTKNVNTVIARRFTVEANTGDEAIEQVSSGKISDSEGEIISESGGTNYQKQLQPQQPRSTVPAATPVVRPAA